MSLRVLSAIPSRTGLQLARAGSSSSSRTSSFSTLRTVDSSATATNAIRASSQILLPRLSSARISTFTSASSPPVLSSSTQSVEFSRGRKHSTMAPLPPTMTGVIIEKTGGTEVLQYRTDLPLPKLAAGEVLVKNEFIGVNFIDTYFRTGLYTPPAFPYTLGRDGAGTIAALSPDTQTDLKPSDTVVYLAERAYAEYTAVPAARCTRIPDKISTFTAAASLLQGLTALTLIRESYPVKKGDWVLVHAAAGGTGLLLVQLLKAVGARTIATASTEAKRELARKAGAEVLVDYTTEDVRDRVLSATSGEGVAAVFDGVGKQTFDVSLGSVKRKGTMVSFGNASGAVEPFSLARLAPKNIKLLRPQLFGYITTPEEYKHYVDELFGFLARGELDVRVHDTYELKDVARAHQDLEGRKTTGKLILKP